MLFNSFEFIFVFLPIVFIGYFLLNRFNKTEMARFWLVITSLFFYGWWNFLYLPLIIGSMFFNYFIGKKLVLTRSRALLISSISLNVLFLGYYKYADFFIENFNFLAKTQIDLFSPLLPLAISFFTFQQIAFLVDCYRDEGAECNIWNYFLFVSFFPQLIAGPIVHHKEVLPQFSDQNNRRISLDNVAKGIFIFSMGLFKKVVIADTLASFVHYGFDETSAIPLIQAWITSFAYTFQLYFDFSGYSDMAIGGALLFNIELCINFNSPYKATNIQDFWQRWHMSLSRFLKDYLYIPLGGNRGGHALVCRNLFITFFLAGMWHGAGWTFIIWGVLHGIAVVVHRTWHKLGLHMSRGLGWLLTFLFVNMAWIFFRAKSWASALNVLKGTLGLNGMGNLSPSHVIKSLYVYRDTTVIENGLILMVLFAGIIAAFYCKNSYERLSSIKLNYKELGLTACFITFSVIFMQEFSEFLYFNF